jgi:hypothetical protein
VPWVPWVPWVPGGKTRGARGSTDRAHAPGNAAQSSSISPSCPRRIGSSRSCLERCPAAMQPLRSCVRACACVRARARACARAPTTRAAARFMFCTAILGGALSTCASVQVIQEMLEPTLCCEPAFPHAERGKRHEGPRLGPLDGLPDGRAARRVVRRLRGLGPSLLSAAGPPLASNRGRSHAAPATSGPGLARLHCGATDRPFWRGCIVSPHGWARRAWSSRAVPVGSAAEQWPSHGARA